jgi:hypothetical protein
MTSSSVLTFCALLTLWSCSESVAPREMTLGGRWTAQKDAAQTRFAEATEFQLVLAQSDSTVTGSWGATGPNGVVVESNQQAGGWVRGTQVELWLRYSQYDHGCVGPARQCFDIHYRLLGEFTDEDVVRVRLTGPPHPTLPDDELVTFAVWTFRRTD